MADRLPTATPLPIPRTRLIGRESERAIARAMLLDESVPLLTLTGPGGSGKTRLALAIAEIVASQFADGIIWIDLAPLADPSLLLATAARALEIVAVADAPLAEQLVRHLRRRQTLLLLDNCEHLLPAAAELVATLLAACPALQILATSRSPLHVRGEQELPVAPLPLPPERTQLADLPRHDALRLFAERTRAVRPEFRVDDANALTVADICRRLDGLPLAIELAASRMRVLSPDALLAQMSDRLRLLSGGPRDAPARQQTIRDTLLWSYSLLTPPEQALFRSLSVFAGGWTLDAAQAVADDLISPGLEVLDGMTSLLDQAMVRRGDGVREPRFTMLEIVREFGQEQLRDRGEVPAARAAHARYFTRLAALAEPDLVAGAVSRGWYHRMDEERDNIRAALTWFLDQRDGAAMTLAGTLVEYWWFRSQFAEGRAWCERALALANDETPLRVLGAALYGASALACMQGDDARALAAGQTLLALAKAAGDHALTARAGIALCEAERRRGAVQRAIAYNEMAIRAARQGDDSSYLPWALVQAIEEPIGVEIAEAVAACDEAIALFQAAGSEWGLSHALHSRAQFALRTGDIASGAAQLVTSLAMSEDIGERMGAIEGLVFAAHFAAFLEDDRLLLRLLGAIQTWAGELGYEYRGTGFPDLDDAERRACVRLGSAASAAILAEGHALAPPAAMAEARHWLATVAAGHSSSVTDPDHRPMPSSVVAPTIPLPEQRPMWRSSGRLSAAAPPHSLDLTRREREILHLLSQRFTNQEIAAQLFVSDRTIESHVARILTKLDAANRREAVAVATRLGFFTPA